MHMGKTSGTYTANPFLDLEVRQDGAVSADGRIIGCYVHGLFASDNFRHSFLNSLQSREQGLVNFEARIDETLNSIADHLEKAINLDQLLELAAKP